jgi:hypothetical protein
MEPEEYCVFSLGRCVSDRADGCLLGSGLSDLSGGSERRISEVAEFKRMCGGAPALDGGRESDEDMLAESKEGE